MQICQQDISGPRLAPEEIDRRHRFHDVIGVTNKLDSPLPPCSSAEKDEFRRAVNGMYYNIDEDADQDLSMTEAFQRGRHKSFLDYRERYRSQLRIQEAGLSRKILRNALVGLKGLRSISVCDWRGLARANESYDVCAHRLFGNTLEPLISKENDVALRAAFLEILDAYGACPEAKIERFNFGPHPFEHPSMPRAYQDWQYDRHELDAIHLSPLALRQSLDSPLQAFFSELRELYLPLTLWKRHGDYILTNSLYPRGMFVTASKLTHLTLPLERPPQEQGSITEESALPGRSFLKEAHFPHLQMLDLRQWAVSIGTSAQFL